MAKAEVVFAVRKMGEGYVVASRDKEAAKDVCRELNAATFPGRYQVEPCLVVNGTMI